MMTCPYQSNLFLCTHVCGLFTGAFGFVFKGTLSSAKDPTVQETVALKTLKSECLSLFASYSNLPLQ